MGHLGKCKECASSKASDLQLHDTGWLGCYKHWALGGLHLMFRGLTKPAPAQGRFAGPWALENPDCRALHGVVSREGDGPAFLCKGGQLGAYLCVCVCDCLFV